jgi:hypothetical protein
MKNAENNPKNNVLEHFTLRRSTLLITGTTIAEIVLAIGMK